MTIATDTPVRVRTGRGAERDAVVLEDRGSRYRVRYEDGTTDTVLHERVRVVNVRKTVMLPPRLEAVPDLAAYAAVREASPHPALRGVPKPPKPWRSHAYLRYVRSHPCLVSVLGALPMRTPCAGDVVAHHHGPRGTGEKTDDSRTVPLCDRHHREFHGSGSLGGLDRAALDHDFTVHQASLLLRWMTEEADGSCAAIIDALTGALLGGAS